MYARAARALSRLKLTNPNCESGAGGVVKMGELHSLLCLIELSCFTPSNP
jgi:hypothetical protein